MLVINPFCTYYFLSSVFIIDCLSTRVCQANISGHKNARAYISFEQKKKENIEKSQAHDCKFMTRDRNHKKAR